MPEDDFKGHRTPEQRITANEPIALFEDLENLQEDELLVIAQECDEDADPDACVACRAYAMWMDLQKEQTQEALAALPGFAEAVAMPEDEEILMGPSILPPEPTREQLAAFEEDLDDDHGVLEEAPDEDDLRQFFIDKVEDLHLSVRRLMEGPPIPPPNISLADLALLTIGSREWIRSCKQQVQMGYVLTPERAKIAEQVERLLGRIDQ